MAIHPDLKSMLRESLPEYLQAADYSITFRKNVGGRPDEPGACLGYPAALTLFSIVDVIGSFHRHDAAFRAVVDGKSVQVRSDGFHHFYVLNSDYYGQTLSNATIKRLYDNFRSLLVHNAALAPEHFLLNYPGNHVPFPVTNDRQCVNLPPFLEVSRQAVRQFLARLDKVVPASAQAKDIACKT